MPASELDILGTYLCCAEKFHHIKTAIDKTSSVTMATKLRDNLRSRTANNRLHFSLEKYFDNHINSLKEKEKLKDSDNGTD